MAVDTKQLYLLSEKGYLISVDEISGQENWRVEFSNAPFVVSTVTQNVGGYGLWFDTQNKIAVVALGDSCQLIAIGEYNQ